MTCHRKHSVLFSNFLEYHILNSPLQDPTRHHESCQGTESGSRPTYRSFKCNEGNSNILHQVATCYTPISCTVPPHIFASYKGASMRRTRHHSKVPSTSHFLMLLLTNLSFMPTFQNLHNKYCTESCNLENGPISRPTFL